MARTSFCSIVAVANLLAAGAIAQCQTSWVPGITLPGTDGTVNASLMWDPDGPGPASERLVIGGAFERVGSQPANRIAMLDPVSGRWLPIGAGLGTFGAVQALLQRSNGELIAAGTFVIPSANGQLNRVARWDGTTWQPLGSGTNGPIHALVELPSGDLLVGGSFNSAGGGVTSNMASWDGTTWSDFRGIQSPVHGLCVMPGGDIVAVGAFVDAGGVQANHIARWDGNSWWALGSGLNGIVTKCLALPNGDLIVAGTFSGSGTVPANGIARWNGTSWLSMGVNWAGGLAATASGNVLITARLTWSTNLMTWNGVAWTTGPATPAVTNICVGGQGEVVIGGAFEEFAQRYLGRLARLSSGSWEPLGPLTDDGVRVVRDLGGGPYLVGGDFTSIDGVAANRIARFDGVAWNALGAGVDGPVTHIVKAQSGMLFVAGSFQNAGVLSASHIAGWNGAGWSRLGNGLPQAPTAVVELANGDLLAAWSSSLSRWNGSSWATLPGVSVSHISDMVVLPNGDLVVVGLIRVQTVYYQGVSLWNGSSWTALGIPHQNVNDLEVLDNGDLIVAAPPVNGSPVPCSFRWSGTGWVALSTGFGSPVSRMPDGALAASGARVTNDARVIARWDGAGWVSEGTVYGPTSAMHPLDRGELVVVGACTSPGLQNYEMTASLVTSCPATSIIAGSGCSGPGGNRVLATDSLPWVGRTFRSRATGLPLNAFAVAVLGLGMQNPPVPLANVHPLGQPGCELHATADLAVLVPAAYREAAFAVGVPNIPQLAGVQVFHQMGIAELDANNQLVAVTSTNALRLTLGAF